MASPGKPGRSQVVPRERLARGVAVVQLGPRDAGALQPEPDHEAGAHPRQPIARHLIPIRERLAALEKDPDVHRAASTPKSRARRGALPICWLYWHTGCWLYWHTGAISHSQRLLVVEYSQNPSLGPFGPLPEEQSLSLTQRSFGVWQ
jgi:hypothetical protein